MTISREQIKQVFLAHGFTIKPGHDDLKEYVYAAAEALIAQAQVAPEAAQEAEPVAVANRGTCAFWVKWTDAAKGLYGPGIKLYAAPQHDADHIPDTTKMVDAELLELLTGLLREIDRNTCTHEETHRGGFIWEICDMCGAKWADDEGGKPEFKWPEIVERARAKLATLRHV